MMIPGIIIGCLLIGFSFGFAIGILIGNQQKIEDEYDSEIQKETSSD